MRLGKTNEFGSHCELRASLYYDSQLNPPITQVNNHSYTENARLNLVEGIRRVIIKKVF